MNLAFGALLLLIFLFPGIICRIGFLNGPYSRKNISSSLLDELIMSILPSMLIQVIGYSFVEYILDYNINTKMLYQIISGPSSAFKEELDYNLMEASLIPFLAYTLLISTASFATGHLARFLVFYFNLDILTHWFRVNNDWYYLLSARKFNWEQRKKKEPEAEIVQVDVMTEGNDADYLYSGVLERFFLSAQGLDTLYLSGVYRRKITHDRMMEDGMSTDRSIDDRYYKMPGNLFVIPYKEIKNLNVSYYKLSEESEEVNQ